MYNLKDKELLRAKLESKGFSWEEYESYRETGKGFIYEDRILIDRIINEWKIEEGK